MLRKIKIEKLDVLVFNKVIDMGNAAANFVDGKLKEAIELKGEANLILATGSSQFSFLKALKKKDLDWQKITVFHLDEYKGISEEHPASFRKYLKERILNDVNPRKIYFLNGDADNIEKEIKNYSEELEKHPIDVACIGIGENGHIAFNDPHVADFEDPELVKLVKLDEACRNQQLGEGWFSTFNDVPKEALTLTIKAIMKSKVISCVVPDQRKAYAIKSALFNEISTNCPASILRTHPNTKLFLDTSAASEIK